MEPWFKVYSDGCDVATFTYCEAAWDYITRDGGAVQTGERTFLKDGRVLEIVEV